MERNSVLAALGGFVIGLFVGMYYMFYHGHYTQVIEIFGPGENVVAKREFGPTDDHPSE